MHYFYEYKVTPFIDHPKSSINIKLDLVIVKKYISYTILKNLNY